MKVVAIQGSPRRGGNTEIVLESVLAGLTEASPVHLKVVRAADKEISGCQECFTCQTVKDTPGCAIQDDMREVYSDLLEADLVILASPVFCWGVTAQLKAILDRMYACFKFDETPPRFLLTGKKMALVITSGGGPNDGANLCEAMYDQLVSFGQSSDGGRLICPLMKGPSQTRRDGALLARAKEFGRSLA
jgi:multimeric flavodoxin WrbA